MDACIGRRIGIRQAWIPEANRLFAGRSHQRRAGMRRPGQGDGGRSPCLRLPHVHLPCRTPLRLRRLPECHPRQVGHRYRPSADIPVSLMVPFGILLGSAGAGLLAGLAVPGLGTVVAAGLVAYFVIALGAHLRRATSSSRGRSSTSHSRPPRLPPAWPTTAPSAKRQPAAGAQSALPSPGCRSPCAARVGEWTRTFSAQNDALS